MELLAAIWVWLVSTGTNTYIVSLITNNLLLLWLITKLTPGDWDNKLFNAIKERIGLTVKEKEKND